MYRQQQENLQQLQTAQRQSQQQQAAQAEYEKPKQAYYLEGGARGEPISVLKTFESEQQAKDYEKTFRKEVGSDYALGVRQGEVKEGQVTGFFGGRPNQALTTVQAANIASQVYKDPTTGTYKPLGELQQNLQTAIQQNKISQQSAQQILTNVTGGRGEIYSNANFSANLPQGLSAREQKQIRPFIQPIAEQLRQDVQKSLFQAQGEKSYQGQLQTFINNQDLKTNLKNTNTNRFNDNILGAFEKEISGQTQREKSRLEASQRVEDIFRVIPFLRGNNFAQKAARYTLSLPNLYFGAGLGGLAASQSEKAYLLGEGLGFTQTRQSTLSEAKSALKQTPSAILESFNPTIPQGLVNLGLMGTSLLSGTIKTTPETIKPVDITLASAAEFKSAVSPQGNTLIRVNPVEFIAKIGKKVVRGIGTGNSIITESGQLRSIFGFSQKEGKSINTLIGVKGITKATDEGFRALTIQASIEPSTGKTISRSISGINAKQIVGGDFPRYVIKTSEYSPTLKQVKLQPQFGRIGILRKDYSIETTNLAGQPINIETFSLFEKGTTDRQIGELFGESKFVKQAQGNINNPLPQERILTTIDEPFRTQGSEQRARQVMSGQGESIVGGAFLRAIESFARQNIGEMEFVQPRIPKFFPIFSLNSNSALTLASPSLKTRQSSIQEVSPVQIQSSDLRVTQIPFQSQDLRNIQSQRQTPRLVQNSILDTVQSQDLRLLSSQVVQQELKQEQQQRLRQIQQTSPIFGVTVPTIPLTIPTGVLPINLLSGKPESAKRKGIMGRRGYNVLVKRKQAKLGKKRYKSRGFSQANITPLTLESAQGLGAQLLKSSARRSFTIKPTGGEAVPDESLENYWRRISYQFRQGKRNKDLIIKKTAYSIQTPQEKAEIPYAALRMRRAGIFQSQRSTQSPKKVLRSNVWRGMNSSSPPKSSPSIFSSKVKQSRGFFI